MDNDAFPISRRGYDMDSVDACIDDLRSEVANATERISQLETDLATARGKEEAVHLTLLAATKTKDELIEAAQQQLESATAEAQEEADRILSEAQYEAFRMITEATENSEEAVAAAREEADRVIAQANEKATRLVDDAEAQTSGAEARAEEIISAATQRAAALDGEYAEMMSAATSKLESANSEAETLITEAQTQADQLVENAKSEAASIVAEAKDESAERVSEARKEAMTIVTNIEEETARLLAEREVELAQLAEGFERDHAEVSQRLVNLRALAARLGHQMQTLAEGNLDQLLEIGKTIANEAPELPAAVMPPVGLAPLPQPAPSAAPAPSAVVYSPNATEEPAGSFETYTTSYTVPLAPMTSETEPVAVEDAVAPRASRYSRRSANLPRLGDAAGGILSAVGALRLNGSGSSSAGGRDDGDEVVDLISA